MTEADFEKLIQNTAENFGDSYIDTSLLSYEPHEFSARFERKMRKLIKKQRRFYFPLVKTPLRLSFTVIVMVILMTITTMMSVGAVREAIFNFFINTFSTHSDITAIDDEKHPDTILEKYDITYDLSNYQISYELYADRERTISYAKNDKEIVLSQYVNDAFNMRANTEGAVITHINLNGYDAIYYFNHIDYHNLIWDNGRYTFFVSSNAEKEEVFSMAKSVMPTGKYDKSITAPIEDQEIYEIGYMKDKQSLSSISVWHETNFEIERDYDCGDYCIKLRQIKKGIFTYEDANCANTPDMPVKINGIDGMLFYDDPYNMTESDYKNIYWENDKYIFIFTGNCPKDEAIKFAESVRKSE